MSKPCNRSHGNPANDTGSTRKCSCEARHNDCPAESATPPAVSVEVLGVDGVVGVAVGSVAAAVLRIQAGEQSGGLVVEAGSHQRDAEKTEGGAFMLTEPAVADPALSNADWGAVLGVLTPLVDPRRRLSTGEGAGRDHVPARPSKVQRGLRLAPSSGDGQAKPITGQRQITTRDARPGCGDDAPRGVVRLVGVVPHQAAGGLGAEHHTALTGPLNEPPARAVESEGDVHIPLTHRLCGVAVVVADRHVPATRIGRVSGRNAGLTPQGISHIATRPVRAGHGPVRRIKGTPGDGDTGVGTHGGIRCLALAGAVTIHIETVGTTLTPGRTRIVTSQVIDLHQTPRHVIGVDPIRTGRTRPIGRTTTRGPLTRRPARRVGFRRPAEPLLVIGDLTGLGISSLAGIGQVHQLTGRIIRVPADDAAGQLLHGRGTV